MKTCEKCIWYHWFEFEDKPYCTLHDFSIVDETKTCMKFSERILQKRGEVKLEERRESN